MRARAHVTTAEWTILGSGAIGFLVPTASWFDAATSSPRSWSGSPLFAYTALLGLLVPTVVVLLRVLGRRLPVGLFGASWPQVHLGAAAFSLGNTVALVAVSSPAPAGSVVAALGAIGVGIGAVQLHREAATGR